MLTKYPSKATVIGKSWWLVQLVCFAYHKHGGVGLAPILLQKKTVEEVDFVEKYQKYVRVRTNEFNLQFLHDAI
jgi:hypothetical protein